MRIYMAERYRSFMERAIKILGGVCVECGSTKNLEIDHIDPKTKTFTLANATAFKWETLEAELPKCQVLCRSCHAEKSGKEASERQKKKYSDPAERAKQSVIMRAAYAKKQESGIRTERNAEYRANLSRSVSQAWKDGKYEGVKVGRKPKAA